jgi:hypothetical protein
MNRMLSKLNFMTEALRPVNLKAQPPQTNMITGYIGTRMDVFFDIRIRDHKPHSNVPKPSIAYLGE